MELLNTLYVTTKNAYLRLENETICVKVGDESKLRVPLHHLSSVVLFGNVGLSTPLLHKLADGGKTLVFLDGSGRFKARLEGGVTGSVLLRQAQHLKSLEKALALGIAQSCVAGKLKNSRQVLLRAARESTDETESATLSRVADNLAASLRSLSVASDMDVVRGIEGEAARNYFSALNLIVKPEMRDAFRLDGRSRRPPRDRFNAVLSFSLFHVDERLSFSMRGCRSGSPGRIFTYAAPWQSCSSIGFDGRVSCLCGPIGPDPDKSRAT